MVEGLRKTGIGILGDLPWGTHFCHFYETKQDLLDTLIPYFKAGLESNEFCLWVVSDADLITVEEARGALAQAVPDLDRHLAEENIEILNGHDWYFEEHALNLERAKHGWDAKLKRALARGYEGLRVSADTFWLREKEWKDFCAYEKQVNDWVTDQPMTVLCTYPLAKSGAAEVLDVVQAHQFAIATRQGNWDVIQSPEPPQARAEIARLNKELSLVQDRTPEPPAILRYAVAVLAVIAALIINRVLNINLVGAPAMLFLCALMFSAWYGGVKPSLVAMPLAVLAFAYYFVTPINSWSVDAREIPRLLLFVMSSLFVISLSGAQRRASGSLRHARDVLAGTVEELKRTNQALRRENTERTHAENNLREQKETLQKIFDYSPVMIGFVGQDGRVKLVNPQWERTIGWTPKELQEQNVDIFEEAYPDLSYRQEVLNFVSAATGELVDLKIKVRDGRIIDAACAVVRLSDGTRVAIAQDITERKGAEEALRRSEDHLRLVIETIPVMAWSTTPDGVVDFLSKRWMEYAGVSLEKYVQDPTGPIHPDDITKVMEKWRAVMAEGELYEEEMRLRRADGEYRWFLVRTAPLRDEGGKIVKWYGVCTDIDDRTQAEQQLKATTEQLRALSASLQSAREQESTRIARELHDELGSALTSLKWDLALLKKEPSPVRDQILDMEVLIDKTINSVRRISAELRPSILDDLGLIAALQHYLRDFTERTSIVTNFDSSVDDAQLNLPQMTALYRITQEALTNVLRHAEATSVNVTAREQNGGFVLSICDNGRGFTESGPNGSSLGLLGMRERARLVGGKIDIASGEESGTTITVTIPITNQQ